jgi:hypothetical protein
MFKTIKNPFQSIIGVAGQPVPTDLRNGVLTRALQLRTSVGYNVTVAGTRVVNKGSAWGLWDFIKVVAGGEEVVNMDGRSLRALAEAFAPSILSATRLAGTGVANSALAEAARLSFGTTLGAMSNANATPMATAFREKNPGKKLQLTAQLRADGGAGGLMTGGTVVITAPTISGEQILDDLTAGAPDFIPFIRQDVITVAAANPLFTYLIQSPNYLRGILIQQDTDQGEVGDIVTSLAMRMAGRDIIGPAQVAWDNMVRDQENDFGGAVYTTGVSYGQSAYLYLNFVEGGRLSNIIPGNATNLRFEFNFQPSAQVGVTVSRLRITFYELARTPGLVRPSLPYNP